MAASDGIPRRYVLDGLVAVWCAAWLAMAFLVAADIRDLARLSETVVTVGRAADRTGATLETIGRVPLIGGDVPETAAAIREAGRSAIQSAEEVRPSVRRASVLLGIAVATVPTLPVLLAYLPVRVASRRDRRRIAEAVHDGRDAVIDTQLALRAIERLPQGELRAISRDPWADFVAGRHRALADAELVRLGVRRERRAER